MSGRKLGRTTKQRQALFTSLLIALIDHGRIRTTEAKAKAVRRLAEKLVTQGRRGTLHARRLLVSVLKNRAAVKRFVEERLPEFTKHTSGVTRILRVGSRRGDGAMMVVLEWVTTEQATLTPKVKKPIRRPSAKKTAAAIAQARPQGKTKPTLRPTVGGTATKRLPRTTHK